MIQIELETKIAAQLERKAKDYGFEGKNAIEDLLKKIAAQEVIFVDESVKTLCRYLLK